MNSIVSSISPDGSLAFPFLVGMLILVRIIVALSLTPYLGMKPVQANVRMALALSLTIFIYPFVRQDLTPDQMPQNMFVIMALLLKEALFGVLIGLVNIMIFFGIQSAGNMIDNQRSLANARIFNPSLGSQASIFGIYFYQLVIAIFLTIGGHRHFLKSLLGSYEKVPILTFPRIDPGAKPILDFIMRLSADTLIICLQFSAPILIAIFIADLVLGITNRIAPMINVFEMGFNLKGYVGSALLYLALPILVLQSEHWFQNIYLYIDRVIAFFGKS